MVVSIGMTNIQINRLLEALTKCRTEAHAAANKLMTCRGDTIREGQQLSYLRGQENAFNEALCVVKGYVGAARQTK